MQIGFTPAELPPGELRRVAALRALEVLDTPAEEVFDSLVQAAALVCNVPISLISLVDSERQWFKAKVGVDVTETPRELAFCAHAILGDGIFEVPNALQDVRFAGNPFVVEAPDIRFYAGAPLVLSGGERIGTFCVIDRVPRQLTATQRDVLRHLATSASVMLQQRKQARDSLRLQIELEREREAVATSEKLYHTVVDSLSEGIVVHAAGGPVTSCNRSAEVMLGLTFNQMVGRAPLDPGWQCVYEDMTPWARDSHPAVVSLETAQPVRDAVMGVRKPDGSLTWVSINAIPIFQAGELMPYQAVASFVDITERKLTQLKLLRSEQESRRTTELLNAAISAIDEGFVVYDPDDRVLICNDRYREIFADGHLMVPGAHFEDILRQGVAQNLYLDAVGREEAWFEACKAEHASGNITTLQRHANGRYLRAVERKLADGHTVGFRIDITELMEATETARAATVAKSQFLANMSHELRTPMNAVIGMLSLLANTELTHQQLDYVNKCRGAAVSLLSLLNDILDISKVEAGKLALDLQPVDLQRLMRDISVILAANVGGKAVEVLYDFDADLPPWVMLDGHRLQQVLLNLAGNGIKFTAQGEVIIRIRVLESALAHCTMEFSVHDTGIGISPEAQSRLFNDFSQADASMTRTYGGTGLGLAISQRLVKLMGGEIALQSTLGVGSSFSFRIRAQLPVTAPDGALTSTGSDMTPRRTLVVDDNPVSAGLMAQVVRSWNWPVTAAHGSAEALACIEKEGGVGAFPYSVVYLDWHMPDMDGWELAGRIRQLAQRSGAVQPTIVMVTGQTREHLAHRTASEQALLNAFLVKPMTASMMLEATFTDAKNAFKIRAPGSIRCASRRLEGLRILVVEDNLINQQVAKELLRHEGALVTLASNGQLGVDAVAAAQPPFDAVLMDIQMPVMDGYTATKRIRSSLGQQALPIIAMTANAMASDRLDCIAAGMNEHVGKPFDIHRLVTLLLGFTRRRLPAPTASVRPTADIPNIEGLDLHAAVARLGGSRDLYLRSAREFLKQLPDVVVQFEHAARNDPKAAALHMHSLKGVAALVGADALSQVAARMEVHLRGAPDYPGLETDIQALLGRVLQTIESLTLAVAVLGDDLQSYAAQQAPQAEAPVEVLVQQLHALQALLRCSDLAALERFCEFQGRLAGRYAAALHPLELAMEALDFESALAACPSLEAALTDGS